jgi:hypothetical protein
MLIKIVTSEKGAKLYVSRGEKSLKASLHGYNELGRLFLFSRQTPCMVIMNLKGSSHIGSP